MTISRRLILLLSLVVVAPALARATPPTVDVYATPVATAAITVPAAATAGDIAVLFANANMNAAWGSAPTGWSAITGCDQHTSLNAVNCYSKTLVSGDLGATVTVNPPSGTTVTDTSVVAIKNAGSLDVALSQHNASSTTDTVPGGTPTETLNELLLNIYSVNPGASETFSAPSNSQVAIGQANNIGLYDLALTNANATGSMTATISTGRANAGTSILFAGPTPTATPSPTPVPRLMSTSAATLPLGTVTGPSGTGTPALTACPAGTPIGANCYLATVSCPYTDNLQVTYSYAPSRVSGPAAGLAVYLGGTPESSFTGATAPGDFLDALTVGWNNGKTGTVGANVAQVAWTGGDWELASPAGAYPPSMLRANCRQATILNYLDQTYVGQSQAFGVMTLSAGGGSAVYALARYGAWQYIDDLYMMTFGAQSNMLGNCMQTTTISLGFGAGTCAAATHAMGWPGGSAPVSNFPDTKEGTTTCAVTGGAYQQADLWRWGTDEVDNPIGNFAWPHTKVAAAQCYQANVEPTAGQTLAQLINTGTGFTNFDCLASTVCSSVSPEQPWTTDGSTSNVWFTNILNIFEANFVRSH